MSVEQEQAQGTGRAWWVFAPAVFLSAFLVFQVQPLVSKHILPWFGGTSSVWTTCLLVFQALLFAGYLYAHGLGRLSPARQTAAHLTLLAVASLVSILPADVWKPHGDEDPLLRIVFMLVVTVGLPYFALSATGPLLQVWSWRAFPGRSPYPLYALSNAGSLLALLSYPFVFEPLLSTTRQAALWRTGFVVFLVLCAAAAFVLRRRAAVVAEASVPLRAEAGDTRDTSTFSPRLQRLLWLGWSACSVILFMAVTNQLTVNVASVPFLWILPLSLYLVTFIVAFSGRRVYFRSLGGAMLAVAIVALTLVLQTELDYVANGDLRLGITTQIAIVAAALFLMCLVCHGELYRLRPGPERLTSFYLWISFGGVVGGLVVGVAAPLAFLLYQELHLGMLLCCVLYLVVALKDPASPLARPGLRWAAVPLVSGVVVLGLVLSSQTLDMLRGTLDTRRNFFGLLRVYQVGVPGSSGHALQLFDGSTLHGYQFVRPDLQARPTVYYSDRTGVGATLNALAERGGRRVGVVGLGVGTLAAYGRTEDYLRFYEINPDVIDLATNTFAFLDRCPAEWDIALGDARLKLEQEPDQNFDVLVLDAFSSDAIPVHLLTVEAFDVYERHLRPGGVIAVHISNLHLDLSSLLYRVAERRGFYAMEVVNPDRREDLTVAAAWMVLSRDLNFMKKLTADLDPLRASGDVQLANREHGGRTGVRPWTDDRSNLFELLR